ncbi:ABC transporter permease subunit [bacterium]|nr:ABC transporter permease subunit [bacterium]
MKIKATILNGLQLAGLGAFDPVVRLLSGENPSAQLPKIGQFILMPIGGFALFLAVWTIAASSIQTRYGSIPNPKAVWVAGSQLLAAHQKTTADRQQFYVDRDKQAKEYVEKAATLRTAAADPKNAALKDRLDEAAVKNDGLAASTMKRKYAGSPSYLDQIRTSLLTVFTGFVLASAIAIPVGILCGLSPVFMACVNPFIQIFKPVSPLAWLPIVMIVVGALYTTDPSEAWFEKSFISSAITVALCSLWPTLTNTALGVASIDKDYINVARVLQLSPSSRVFKIILPASLPLMFTGLRISLGVGWMVLIAAEMLAQNPGLGKFVWDMFQNGSSETLAQIMVAVFTIGGIGFLLDRIMIVCQRMVSFDSAVSA